MGWLSSYFPHSQLLRLKCVGFWPPPTASDHVILLIKILLMAPHLLQWFQPRLQIKITWGNFSKTLGAQVLPPKILTQLFRYGPLAYRDLEKAMAPHSSTLAWKIPWTEEPGGLQSMGHEESDTTERLHFDFSLSRIGEENGNPLQCSCLENPRDGGARWAAVYGVTQN